MCDPSENRPPPKGLAPWSGAIPQGVPAWIWPLANDTSIPVNSLYFKAFNGETICARVECHTYTVKPDGTRVPGHYHGVTLYKVTDPSIVPADPQGGADDSPGPFSSGRSRCAQAVSISSLDAEAAAEDDNPYD